MTTIDFVLTVQKIILLKYKLRGENELCQPNMFYLIWFFVLLQQMVNQTRFFFFQKQILIEHVSFFLPRKQIQNITKRVLRC